MKSKYRIIFHIDMNCFFASCEIAENEELKNKPVIIAHNDVFRKSIILTASYEARKYGIYTTMSTGEAIKLCPHVVIVEPNFQLYEQYSEKFFKYLYTITNKVEPMSIDEGYLDVTDISKGSDSIDLAKKIRDTLLKEYKLPVSIGIGPNKFLAKMASDMKKPLGITILRKREINKYLWPLPVGKMVGVGKKTKPRLESIGIKTIGDLANYEDLERLKEATGPGIAESLIQKANGNDNSKVDYSSVDEVSSVSNSHTFNYNVIKTNIMKDTLKVLSNTVSERLNNRNLLAQTIGIQIKYANFKMINRSTGLDEAINDSLDLWHIVSDLFDDHYDGVSEVRLVGVFATRLIKKENQIKQYTIFDDISQLSRENKIEHLLTKIKKQYGDDSIKVGYYEYEKGDN